MNRDPIGELGGFNRYAFCDNNPVDLIDPLGLWWSSGHRDLTTRAANSLGISPGDIDRIVAANLRVDRLSNQGNNPAHSMPGTLPAFWNDIQGFLDEAVALELEGRHPEALSALGTGLHTQQDFEPHYTQDAGWGPHILGFVSFGWLSPDNPRGHSWEYENSFAESCAYLRQFLDRTQNDCDNR